MNLYFLSTEQILNNEIDCPKEDEIAVCIFNIHSHKLLADDIAMLPLKDREKADSLRLADDKLRHLVSRALLRKVLSGFLSCRPEELAFQKGEHGKPYLLPSNGNVTGSEILAPIKFNLSHSGDYVALAFSESGPVGIDIEQMRDNIRTDSVARRWFHPEEYAMFQNLATEEQNEFVLRRWTAREAYLKGIGSGLTIDPRSVLITGNEISCNTQKSQEEDSSWQIASFLVANDYFCSIAFQEQTITG